MFGLLCRYHAVGIIMYDLVGMVMQTAFSICPAWPSIQNDLTCEFLARRLAHGNLRRGNLNPLYVWLRAPIGTRAVQYARTLKRAAARNYWNTRRARTLWDVLCTHPLGNVRYSERAPFATCFGSHLLGHV